MIPTKSNKTMHRKYIKRYNLHIVCIHCSVLYNPHNKHFCNPGCDIPFSIEQDVCFYTIDKLLMLNVSNLNIEEVKSLLLRGANPNYNKQYLAWVNKRWMPCYLETGEEFPEDIYFDSSTPLKACISRYTNENKKTVMEIAKLLISYGADKKYLLKYYLDRYPKCEEDELYKLLIEEPIKVSEISKESIKVSEISKQPTKSHKTMHRKYIKQFNLHISCIHCSVLYNPHTKHFCNSGCDIPFSIEQDVCSYTIDKLLMLNVNNLNFEAVKSLLLKGADPNYNKQYLVWACDRWMNCYLETGEEFYEANLPCDKTMPLKVCVFKYFKADKKTVMEIAKLLITYGANKTYALSYYMFKYSKCEEDELYKLLVEEPIKVSQVSKESIKDQEISKEPIKVTKESIKVIEKPKESTKTNIIKIKYPMRKSQ